MVVGADGVGEGGDSGEDGDGREKERGIEILKDIKTIDYNLVIKCFHMEIMWLAEDYDG